jgi:hypothetical protein
MMFPVGRMVPGDLSNAADMAFEDFEAFFQIKLDPNLADANDNPDSIFVIVRLEADGSPIFTVGSEKFPSSVLSTRGWVDNTQLARIREISLGGGGEEINANALLPFIDGGMLKTGLYTLTVVVAQSPVWDEAISDNNGITSLPIYARNNSQVALLQPSSGDQVTANPILLWSYPRSRGVNFRLKLVSGNADDDPSNAIESANIGNTFADFYIPNDGMGGDFTAYSYGTRNERTLTPGQTYFWQITAAVMTMFPNDTQFVVSPVYVFTYTPAGRGGGGGGGGDGGGGDDGSEEDAGGGGGGGGGGGTDGAGLLGGPGEEGGGPAPEAPIIGFLRRVLSDDQFESIISQMSQVNNWTLQNITVDGSTIDINELARLLLEGNRTITSVSIQ